MLLAALLLVWAPLGLAWLGVQQRFVDERLIDTGTLGLPGTGLVVALGDYNSDQLLDLVYLSSDQRSLAVYVWDRATYAWLEQPKARIRTASDFIVTNVVPGDYNYDGRLDLLVMGGANPGGWWGDDETVQMQVFLQRNDGSFCQSFPASMPGLTSAPADPYAVNSSTLAQPIPFDATGDMRTDLLGFSPSTSAPQLWNNVWESSNGTEVFAMSAPPLDLAQFDCKFPSPHFNAFVDLDGDCLADLFLTCQSGTSPDDLSYQIWINDKQGGFKLSRKGDLPRGTKSVGFADMGASALVCHAR